MLLVAMDVTKRSRVCSLTAIGSRSASKQKLVNLHHPAEYVALAKGAMPTLRKTELCSLVFVGDWH